MNLDGMHGTRRLRNSVSPRRWWIAAILLGAVACSLLLLGGSRQRALLWNTVRLACATIAISVPSGSCLAFLLLRTDLPGRRVFSWMLAGTLFIPLYIHAAAWQAGFGLEGWFTLAAGGPAWLDGWPAAIWVHSVAALPWVVLIVGCGLRLVDPALEELAVLHYPDWKVFLSVTVRRAWPAVTVAALWVGIVVAGEMTVTDFFRVRTYAEEAYIQTALGGQLGETAVGALPGVLITFWLVLASLAALSSVAAVRRVEALRRPWVFGLRRWRLPLLALVCLVVALTWGVPAFSLAEKAGIEVSDSPAGRIRLWSLTKCLRIVAMSPVDYRREFGWTAATAFLAATTAVATAFPLAWWARSGGLRSVPLWTATALAMAIPGPLLGLFVIWLMNRPEFPPLIWLYDRTLAGPWLVQTIKSLPLAALILWFAVHSIPQELIEAAQVDGAKTLALWKQVVFPMRRTAVAAAWIVAWATAVSELAAGILVVPPGVDLLQVRIFGLVHYGVEDHVAGICLALVILFHILAWGTGSILTRHVRPADSTRGRAAVD